MNIGLLPCQEPPSIAPHGHVTTWWAWSGVLLIWTKFLNSFLYMIGIY